MFRLYDTATRSVSPLVAGAGGRVGMYVCGPTVYGPPHAGHGRATLVYDVLRRYLEWSGRLVHHVSNVTDIDDQIIARANREQRPWQDVASECEAQWWSAMDTLGVARPNEVPHATAYLAGMVELIEALVKSEKAYATADGVYLSVETVPDYGTLSAQSLDQLRAGARVEVIEEKRSPLDFVLWKLAKPGEPCWPSPFGEGRPGWHTECVVMSLALLGEGFSLHCGGQDLMFPHHENERAQAGALGRRFAEHWMHHGFITTSGEKMSKSLNNFTTLEELVATNDPRAYRLLVLQSHYRQPLEVTAHGLADAAGAIARLDALGRRFGDAPPELASTPVSEALLERFSAAMDDDLDTPVAIGALFESVHEANALADASRLGEGAALGRAVLEAFVAVGLPAASAEAIPRRVAAEVRARDAARAAGDFSRADVIRDALDAEGWRLEDTPSGTRVHRRAGRGEHGR